MAVSRSLTAERVAYLRSLASNPRVKKVTLERALLAALLARIDELTRELANEREAREAVKVERDTASQFIVELTDAASASGPNAAEEVLAVYMGVRTRTLLALGFSTEVVDEVRGAALAGSSPAAEAETCPICGEDARAAIHIHCGPCGAGGVSDSSEAVT